MRSNDQREDTGNERTGLAARAVVCARQENSTEPTLRVARKRAS